MVQAQVVHNPVGSVRVTERQPEDPLAVLRTTTRRIVGHPVVGHKRGSMKLVLGRVLDLQALG
jgi:hypothetical protein